MTPEELQRLREAVRDWPMGLECEFEPSEPMHGYVCAEGFAFAQVPDEDGFKKILMVFKAVPALLAAYDERGKEIGRLRARENGLLAEIAYLDNPREKVDEDIEKIVFKVMQEIGWVLPQTPEGVLRAEKEQRDALAKEESTE